MIHFCILFYALQHQKLFFYGKIPLKPVINIIVLKDPAIVLFLKDPAILNNPAIVLKNLAIDIVLFLKDPGYRYCSVRSQAFV